jgi:YgiT-type zinc finger domain-containing protein
MHCQGEMVRGTAPLHIDRRDVHVSLDSVPAWVCAQCGEAYFEESEVNVVQDIVRAVDERAGKLARTG